jgi:pilus assembly protein CpaB
MARISSGTMTVVVFAILVGLGGAFVVRQEMAKPKLAEAPVPAVTPQPVIVPVAAIDLEPGQRLSINDIALMSFTSKEYPKSKYATLAYMRNTNQILSRTLKMGLRKGEAFMPEFLYPEGIGPGITDRLTAGYRAVTVPIENVGSVQGFARPGTWVDVLFRSQAVGKRQEQTLTLLERVEVLAINEILVPNRQVTMKTEGTVTVAVTPQQAKILKVVEGRGELSLALRHPDDTIDMAPFDIGQLDPTLGALNFGAGVIPVSHKDATGRNDRTSDRTGANDAGSVDGIIGDSAERVTLDDLLGFGREPEKRQMEIFMGASKNVVEFEQPADEPAPVLLKSSRIRTPIAHGPALPSTRPASQVRRTTNTPSNSPFASSRNPS